MIAIQIYVLVETQNWDSGVVRKSNPRTATGRLSASPAQMCNLGKNGTQVIM